MNLSGYTMNIERKNIMTRFDIPRVVQTFLNAALTFEVLDVSDALALGATHGDNWDALLDNVMEIAFANHHDPRGRTAHAALCKINDSARAYWAHCEQEVLDACEAAGLN